MNKLDKDKLKREWKSVRMKWTPEEIKEKIMTDDRWLIRGLMAIYNLQTADEKSCGETIEDNGVGFNGVDSEFLSNVAEYYSRFKRLSPKQIKCVRYRRSGKPKLAIYARQLARIANREI